jgi:ribonuclease BN (tRNA processing enzyme)
MGPERHSTSDSTPMEQLLRGYSRGLFTNWLWHRRLQVVVDAGEGLAEGMAGTVLQPTHLLVTHGHSDHVLGLPGFVAARRFGLGDPDKPLTIVHPEGSSGVRAVRRDEVMEEYGQVLFAHTGDSMPLDPALFADADLLVHDATFLDAADQREPAHATAREALDAARDARVARLVLQHLSVRYERPGAWGRLEEERVASGFAGECWLLDGPGFRRIGPEGEPAP